MARQGMGLDVGPSDFIWVHITAKKLDTQSRRQWELHSKSINCSEGHKLYQCDNFKIMSYEDKHKFIKTKKLCFNCLRPGHNSKTCKSKSRCQKCQKLHHTLLHTRGEQTEQSPWPIRIWVTRGVFLRNTSYLQWKCQSCRKLASLTSIEHYRIVDRN